MQPQKYDYAFVQNRKFTVDNIILCFKDSTEIKMSLQFIEILCTTLESTAYARVLKDHH